MPLWTEDELVCAGLRIFGLKKQEGIRNAGKEDPVAQLKRRYEKWGGIPRYVLEQRSQRDQNRLKEDIRCVTIAQVGAALRDPHKIEMRTDKLVHMTATLDYSLGSQQFASKYVEEKLRESLSPTSDDSNWETLISRYRNGLAWWSWPKWMLLLLWERKRNFKPWMNPEMNPIYSVWH